MNKSGFIFILFILLINSATGQDYWNYSGLENEWISTILIDSSGTVYAGSGGNFDSAPHSGIFRSVNNGASWDTVNSGLTNLTIFCIINDREGNLFTSSEGGIFKSDNRGENWTQKNNGLTSTNVKHLILADSGAILAATNDGIFKSYDSGELWQRSGLDGTGIRRFSRTSSNSILAGTWEGVYFSVNNGGEWEVSDLYGYGTADISDFALAGNGIVYSAIRNAGLYQSLNNGSNWTKVEYSETDASIYRIAFNNNDDLLVGTLLDGIYYRETGTDTFNKLDDGLQNLPVYSIAFDKNGYTYIGTCLGGIYKSSIPTVLNDNFTPPSAFSLNQNYPNPFNSKTVIQYQLANQTKVELSIFNASGQIVSTLISEVQAAGEYRITWDAEGYASGVYYYRLSLDGQFHKVNKMLLLK